MLPSKRRSVRRLLMRRESREKKSRLPNARSVTRLEESPERNVKPGKLLRRSLRRRRRKLHLRRLQKVKSFQSSHQTKR